MPQEEFLKAKGVDADKVFAVTDLVVGGKVVSTNLLFFVPTKQAHLPATSIATEIKNDGNKYRLTLKSKVLARSVNISLGNVDAKISDNYFDLIPGQPVEIEITTAATLDQLQAALKVTSLVDAFAKQ